MAYSGEFSKSGIPDNAEWKQRAACVSLEYIII